MKFTIPLSIKRYFYAMNASAADAAIHSASAFFAVAGVHAIQDTVPALTLQQAGGVLLLSFARGLLKYLDDHPLEALLPKSPMEEAK